MSGPVFRSALIVTRLERELRLSKLLMYMYLFINRHLSIAYIINFISINLFDYNIFFYLLRDIRIQDKM